MAATVIDQPQIQVRIKRRIETQAQNEPEAREERWFQWVASRRLVHHIDLIVVTVGEQVLEEREVTTRYMQYRLLGLTFRDELLDVSEVPRAMS